MGVCAGKLSMALLLNIKDLLQQKNPFVIQTKTAGVVSFLPVCDEDMNGLDTYGGFVAVVEFAWRDAVIWCVSGRTVASHVAAC